jgi:tetratricopeptide (TPR) repeat protein
MSWKDLFRRKDGGPQPPADEAGESSEAPASVDPEATAENRLAEAKEWHKAGRVDEAEEVYRALLEQDPRNAEAQHMAAIVCLQKGRLEEAEQFFLQAISLDGRNANYQLNLGNALGAQGRVSEALESYRRAIELDPEHLEAMSNASSALLVIGRPGEAVSYCRRILELRPDDIDARLNLAAAHIEARDTLAAIAILREGLEVEPGHVDLRIQLASALELVNQLDEALEIIRQVESEQHGNARVSMLLGVIARRTGKLDIAEQRLKAALAQGLPPREQIEAFNQLGLALDAAGNAREAFSAFNYCNQAMIHFMGERRADGRPFLAEVQSVEAYFSAEKTKALEERFATDDDFRPVFFVGFPRSGTTLMEQVLKAHPGLVTTDERSPLYAVIREIESLAGGYPNALERLDAAEATRLRQVFKDTAREYIGDAGERLLVDKLPLNIVNLGLARLLFPQAGIIVALRDPRDACLSCFMQKFDINAAMANFLDLKMTARAYQAVMGLWLHYRPILDGAWLEYRYEDLVDDLEGTVTGVLDFIGVGWHEAINDYRQAAEQRAISTPSYRDVTRRVDDRAVARWRRYEQNLQPILPVLEPFVEAFGYGDRQPPEQPQPE